MKELLKNPKKTAIVGLIGILIMLISVLRYTVGEDFFEFGMITMYHTYIWGLLVYFIIVLLRIFKKQGDIKIANYLLIVSLGIAIIGNILGRQIVNVIALVLFGLYILRILFRKKNFVNNKIAFVILILYIIYTFIYRRMIFIFTSDILDYLTQAIGLLLIVPYFYGYFEILEEENKNGK